ncbi:hypothetical protein GGX14DRAFT_394297 [Mycena pura]|uniref:Uncharacterized protein n=1 Tax=Mycena pura TaxID=153505 RepID=A0AAD6VFP0_9AGAR|nr:hypothetical protein GGX14DRAFT_394297 [Mycena pura]
MQHYRALSSSTSASKNTLASNFPERQNVKKPSSIRANTWSHGRKLPTGGRLGRFPTDTSFGRYKVHNYSLMLYFDPLFNGYAVHFQQLELYDLSRWPTLIQSFRRAVCTLNALPAEPLVSTSASRL